MMSPAVAMKLFSSKVTVRSTVDSRRWLRRVRSASDRTLHSADEPDQYDEIQKENHMFPLNGLHYGPDPAK